MNRRTLADLGIVDEARAKNTQRMRKAPHRSSAGSEEQTSMGPPTTMRCRGECTHQATTDPGRWLFIGPVGVRDGLDQHSGGGVACTGPDT